MRLDRLIAASGYGSRAQVKKWIRAGRVEVDGKKATDPGQSVLPDCPVRLDGEPLQKRTHLDLMLHKPAGLITALHDAHRPTIASLLPPHWLQRGLVPIGRLDRDSTGLLLLTNHGQLCHRLASPNWSIEKTYQVTVEGRPFEPSDVNLFAAGLKLADGFQCQSARLLIRGPLQADLVIREGKYHQVKRMMLASGRKVLTLHRSQLGPIRLDPALAPGKLRLLSQDEQSLLYRAVGLDLPQLET